jgi:glycerol-3-phosphate dehydrogenase
LCQVRNSPCIRQVFFAKRLCIDDSKTSDGRVLFAVPWHNKIVVGTTDTVMKHSIEFALETEIEFVLETAQRYLVKKNTGRCAFCFCRVTIGSAR